MSLFTNAEADALSLDKLVNDSALVPTRRNGPKPSYQFLVDGWNAEFAAKIIEINKSRGFRVVGTFAGGFTYELLNDVGIDAAGNSWIYTGTDALPKIITAGTVPSTPDFQQVTYNDHSGLVNLNSEGGHDEIYARSVNSLKSLVAYTPTLIDGQKFDVAGFYANTKVGGGLFIWDASRSKTDHNGGTVISPEALTAWDGTVGDIETLLNWIGTGSGCFVRENSYFCDLSEFGVVYGSLLDSSTSAQRAANTLKKIIVSGPVRFFSNVNFYNDIEFLNGGELIVSSASETLITLTTNQSGTDINPLLVGGLSELSYQVSGFGAVETGGFAVIDSNEELIKRTIGGLYTKDEIIVFSGTSGSLNVGVMENHDISQISSIKYFSPESNIIAKINVTSDSGEVAIDGIIKVYRRSACLSVNISVESTLSVLKIEECPNVRVLNPRISGSKNGLGYGIFALKTGSVLIENPNISNCRHGYSGRHDKNTTVTGSGWVSNDIDSHYGYNMNITDGVTVVGDIKFAGRDVRVSKINHIPLNFGIEMRQDTPEIKGVMSYTENNVTLNTPNDYSVLTIGVGSSSFFEFGRDLESPSSMIVTGNNFDKVLLGSNFRYCWQRNPQSYNRNAPKKIIIGNNSFPSSTPSYIQGLSDFTKSNKIKSSYNTNVSIFNEESIVNNVDDLYLGSNYDYGYSIDCKKINYLFNQIDSGSIADLKIKDSYIAGSRNKNTSLTGVTSSIGYIKFTGCTFSDLAFDTNRSHRHIAFGECKINLMLNDTVIIFKPVSGKATGLITVIRQSDADRSSSFTFDCTSSSVSKMSKLGSAVGINTIDNTSLNGTSGTDGDITLSCNNNLIYLENRSGDSNLFYKIDVF